MVVERAQLYDETMDPVVLTLDDQAGHHDGVGGCLGHTTGPPFGGSECGAMNVEFVGLFAVGGGCFERHHVRAMT